MTVCIDAEESESSLFVTLHALTRLAVGKANMGPILNNPIGYPPYRLAFRSAY